MTMKVATRVFCQVIGQKSKIKRRDFSRDFLENHINDLLNIFIDEKGLYLIVWQIYSCSGMATTVSVNFPAPSAEISL